MKEPRRSSNIQNENALSRKRPKRLSFEDSFLKEDKDYIPPHGSKIRSSQPKQRNKLVTRPAKRNMRDPFMVLNDDLVFLVIDQISAKDTEILRRVSKLWKACSEVHCGRNALQKHFPIAALRAGGILSREEENIRFRRYCKCVLSYMGHLWIIELNYFDSVLPRKFAYRVCHKSYKM